MPMLPVTPLWQRGPGYWGSPFARPRRIELRRHPRGYRIPKGIWLVKCGANRVEMMWRENDGFCDEPRRFPGTGMIGPRFPPPRPPRPPPPHCRPPRPPKPTWPPTPPPRPGVADPLAPPNWEPPWPRPGDNRVHREELIRQFSTGVVYADGFSVVLCGTGEAIAIRIFST